MAKKTNVEASEQQLDEMLTPKKPTKKAKPITEPEPKNLEQIEEITENILAQAETVAEEVVEAPVVEEEAITIEEKVAIIDEINENTSKINEVMNNNPEEGIKLVEKEIERVAQVETKLKADKKQKVAPNRIIYTWNGIQY